MSEDLKYVLEQLLILFGFTIGVLSIVVGVMFGILYIIGWILEKKTQKESNAHQARS